MTSTGIATVSLSRLRIGGKAFAHMGERCVLKAVLAGTYVDRTGNLRASIGYSVFKDGQAVLSQYQETESPTQQLKPGAGRKRRQTIPQWHSAGGGGGHELRRLRGGQRARRANLGRALAQQEPTPDAIRFNRKYQPNI